MGAVMVAVPFLIVLYGLGYRSPSLWNKGGGLVAPLQLAVVWQNHLARAGLLCAFLEQILLVLGYFDYPGGVGSRFFLDWIVGLSIQWFVGLVCHQRQVGAYEVYYFSSLGVCTEVALGGCNGNQWCKPHPNLLGSCGDVAGLVFLFRSWIAKPMGSRCVWAWA